MRECAFEEKWRNRCAARSEIVSRTQAAILDFGSENRFAIYLDAVLPLSHRTLRIRIRACDQRLIELHIGLAEMGKARSG